MRKHRSITKAQIIRRLMNDCGLSYVMANRAHDCFIAMVEESVVNVTKLNLGHVGSITPKIVKGKSVSMNFKRSKVGVERIQRYFYLDERVRFTLRLFKSFSEKVDYQYTKP
jgi:nucleoid DNA-binding protein